MYKITIKGKASKYKTQAEAIKVANKIFEATGIVVAIEKEKEKACTP